METRARRRERQRMYNLNTMPQVAMEQILKYCGFMEINALRKTCTYTRGLVDLIKPDLEIKTIGCSFSSDAITMTSDAFLMTQTYSYLEEERGVVYKNTADGCVVSIDGRASPVKFFKDTTAAEMFCRDFRILLPLLMHQKNPLDDWRMRFGFDGFAVFQTTMGRVLAEFNAQLRTVLFLLNYKDRPDLMTMLPLVCATTLTRLSITNDSLRRDEVFDLSQVAELAQWKNLRRFYLDGCLPDTLCRLKQFSTCWVYCETVAPDDIVSLKEAFRNAPLLIDCVICDLKGRNRAEVRRALSPRGSNDEMLYFSTTTPDYVLSVKLTCRIKFKRVPRSSLKHDDIVIMD